MEAALTSASKVTPYGGKVLHRAGALGALAMAAIIVIQIVFFIAAPPPLEGTAADWFRFFQGNEIAGLVGFELLLVVSVLFSVPLSLALYAVLKRWHAPIMTIYLALSLIGVLCFVVARPAVEMLSLSRAYGAAGSEADRLALLSAGDAMVAIFHGSAFYVSYVLGSLSGLIVSAVMLKSSVFSKTTAWLRIGSSVCDFGLFIPGVGMYISIFSVFFLFAWNLIVARRLIQLSREG